MRIWDLSPGYLNRQSLLGEHRELHGVYAILTTGKTGYSRHPETRRWAKALSGLSSRHAQLVAEMRLRGYTDRSPLPVARRQPRWPDVFVTEPSDQLALLKKKYVGRERGRIPLPRNAQDLWAQHKYSVMARSPEIYRELGRAVAGMRSQDALDDLSRSLVLILRDRPGERRLVNAVEHMWGHVRRFAPGPDPLGRDHTLAGTFARIQVLAVREREAYLLNSTALSDLAVFVGD